MTAIVFSNRRLSPTSGGIVQVSCILLQECAIKSFQYSPKSIKIIIFILIAVVVAKDRLQLIFQVSRIILKLYAL